MWRWQLHSWEHNRNHNCNCNCNLEQRYTFISNTFEYSDSQNVLRNIVTTLRSRKQKPWSSLFTLCQQGYHQVEQQSCGATEAYLWQLNSQYPTKCDKSRIVSRDTKLTMKQKSISFDRWKKILTSIISDTPGRAAKLPPTALRTYSIFGFGWLMIQELVISEKIITVMMSTIT